VRGKVAVPAVVAEGQQVADGRLRAGDDHQSGIGRQRLAGRNERHLDRRLRLQRIEVVEIGDARQHRHRHLQRPRRAGRLESGRYAERSRYAPLVAESFAIVGRSADIVIVEGAGSAAEVNLRDGDIANMGFAEAADVPVILCGDIDRGGVIASLVGTHAVLPAGESARIRGFLINRFRGDPALFANGLKVITERTGWPSLGVVPWFEGARRLPAEDAVGLENGGQGGPVLIAVPELPRIANFDDLDPLRMEPGVSVVIVPPGRPIPAEARLVLIPGSKSTIADLAFLRAQGWDIDIAAHVRRGGHVLGLCGGYQMLGRTIADPQGLEGPPGTVPGLGLLAVDTELTPDKTTVSVTGRHVATGEAVHGYEIHLGRTEGADGVRPFLELEGRPDGARSADGRIAGTYVHGLFAADGFRRAFLAGLGARPSNLAYEAEVEAILDALAAHLEAHVDVDRILTIAGYRR
jgi:adenosylcobyric acid synthase